MNETRETWLARLKRPLSRLQANRTDFYRIQAKTDSAPASVYIYDEIGYFGDSAKTLVKELQALDSDTLDVHINSPGGDVFDGLAIYQALKDHKASVTVHIDGLAASIASVIAMAGDRVVIGPKASMMVHDGWTVAVGNAANLRKTADVLDKQSDIIASVYADKTGQPADFWRGVMAEDSWYNAEEALAAGLVDEVEGRAPETPDEPFDLTVFSHAGRANAPAPALKPSAKPVEPPVQEPPVPEPQKDEPKPFVWDFAAFKDSITKGVNH